MPQYASALGVCPKCQRDKVQVEGGDTKCVFCDFDLTVPTGPVINPPDPGEEEINKILRATGVRVATGDSTPAAPRAAKPAAAPAQAAVVAPIVPALAVDFSSQIRAVLTAMESLPMPKDMKQVKLVLKVTNDLKKILGE